MGDSRRGIEVHFSVVEKGINPMWFRMKNPHSFSTRRPGSQVSRFRLMESLGLGAGQCTHPALRGTAHALPELGVPAIWFWLGALKIGRGGWSLAFTQLLRRNPILLEKLQKAGSQPSSKMRET